MPKPRPLGNVAAARVREAREYARSGEGDLRNALYYQDRNPDAAARHIQQAQLALARIQVLMLELQQLDD